MKSEQQGFRISMRIAVIHDWLVTYAGAERLLEQVLEVFPDADLFSLVDFLSVGNIRTVIANSFRFFPLPAARFLEIFA